MVGLPVDRWVSVIHTWRGDAIGIIAIRKATKHDAYCTGGPGPTLERSRQHKHLRAPGG
jgi:hypothetical protein